MARLKTPVYSFDFETVVDQEHTRVWLWGAVNLENENFKYGKTIDEFMNWAKGRNRKGYFHNIKFDVQFIFYWLFKHGFKHTSSSSLENKQFATLISDNGIFYNCKIKFENGFTLTIYDSLKLIPLPVEDIPKAFGLDIEKLDLDYHDVKYEEDHEPTEDEIKYLHHDCLIVAQGLNAMHGQGLKKLTVASNALSNYKQCFNKNEFQYLFPSLSIGTDTDCRRSYKGGWTYLNPKYKDKMLGIGAVYDVNSMYPWAMKYCKLPYGEPIYYKGEYKQDGIYPLYIQCLRATFHVKQNAFPMIQLKGSMRFSDTEYIESTGDEPALLYLTNVDLELFKDCYDIDYIEYLGGYKFRGAEGIFADYVDYWYEVKDKANHEGNKGLKTIAKLMLNGLYGKFGSNPKKRCKYPYYDEESDLVQYALAAEEVNNDGYVPIASFITSYARDKIVRAAISCEDRFVYADTDSIHILGREEPDIEIDQFKLGAFKEETVFTEAKYHRAKCYIESDNGKLDKKCAGLPKAAREMFNFDTMKEGESFEGKLVPKQVPGGVVLVDRIFTIK